jgi:hypothetical protein
MHAVCCWLLSLILELLPLFNSQYGQDETWCGIAGEGRDPTIWILITFTVSGPLVVCAALMAWFYYRIWRYYRSLDDNLDVELSGSQLLPSKERSLVATVFMYPLGLILAWASNIISSMLFNFDSIRAAMTSNAVDLATIVGATNAIGSLYGNFMFTDTLYAR